MSRASASPSGRRAFFQRRSGTSATVGSSSTSQGEAHAPPPDWPTLVDAVVGAHGGRVYSQQHLPHSNELLLQIVWPAAGHEPSAFNAVRTELAGLFSWQ